MMMKYLTYLRLLGTVLPDWRLSIMPKELTNYARIMPDFQLFIRLR